MTIAKPTMPLHAADPPRKGISSEGRSRIMRAIRAKDTKPELLVRRVVHALGFRYRLHRPDLPGKPDLAFGPLRKAIFVHGCFWHSHPDAKCVNSRMPRSNRDYWLPKLRRTVERDAENISSLKADGWTVMVVWECETKNIARLRSRLRRFLSNSDSARISR